jgi:hypothetical protein
MSLVSINNLLSPFRSKTQMIGLLVTAFIVLIVRWVTSTASPGVDADVDNYSDSRGRGQLNALRGLQLEASEFPDTRDEVDPLGRTSDPSGITELPGDTSIEELLADEPPRPPTSARSAAADAKGLADIRKSLGLD